MGQNDLGRILEHQLKKTPLYQLLGPTGKKLEREIGFQTKATEAEVEESITPEVEATEALMGVVAEVVEGTLVIILSIETVSQEQSMALQDLSDNEKKVKHEVRVPILRLFPKDGDRGDPRLTQTVKFLKVPVTRIA